MKYTETEYFLNLWIFNILLFLITIPIALDPIASIFLYVLAGLTSTCKSYPLLTVVLSYTPVLMSFLFSGLQLAYLPRSTLWPELLLLLFALTSRGTGLLNKLTSECVYLCI